MSCKQNNTQSNTNSNVTGEILQTTQTPPDVANNSDGFYRQLKGKIGTAEVQMSLVKVGTKLYGKYAYSRIGQLIDLSPRGTEENIDADGKFVLFEFATNKDGEYDQTGTFNGQILPNGLVKGVWTSADEKKNLNFELNDAPSNDAADISISIIEKQEGDCEGESEATCAHFEVIYPTIKQLPDRNEQTKQLINTTILNVLAESMPTEQTTAPDKAAEQFIRDFKDQDSEYKMSWEYELTTEVYQNANNILSIGFANYIFTGGAHPNHSESYYNFNLKTGQLIELDDVFKPKYETQLTALAEQKIRSLHNIGAKSPLSEAGFFEDKFELNDNFSISATGITFLYNPYEITPYAMGEQLIFISFKEVKDLLQPNGLINWSF